MKLVGALLAGAIAAASLGLAEPAAAQGLPFNCAALSGSPFLCIKNESGKALVGIQVVARGGGWYNPHSWINISVPPGGGSVVKFPTYKGCIQNVVVRSDDSQPHYFWNTDVCHTTSLRIAW